jgi:hypothetical protein
MEPTGVVRVHLGGGGVRVLAAEELTTGKNQTQRRRGAEAQRNAEEKISAALCGLCASAFCPIRVHPEIRSSKSKIRKKSEARSPKEQILCGAAAPFSERPPRAVRISDFGPLSDFADSDFGFRVHPCSSVVEILFSFQRRLDG